MKNAFGIDLGTTRTAIAMIAPFQPDRGWYGNAQVVKLPDGLVTPSAILFDEDSQIVGMQAKNLGHRAKSCAQVFKRKMNLEETHADYLFAPESRGRETFDPVDLSSILLRYVRDRAADVTGMAVDEVVITVPAYFGERERRRTREAGERAGLEVLDIINEPTAAMLGYLFQPLAERLDEPVLVFDLGGGTFDTVVVVVDGNRIDVASIKGDAMLGGRDFDNTLSQYLTDEFLTAFPDASPPTGDPATKARLLLDVERNRELLSATTVANIPVYGYGDNASNMHNVTLTRDDMERSLNTLIGRCIDITRDAMDEARNRRGVTPRKVLFVGGTTHTPAIRERVLSEFGLEEIRAGNDPDQLVAMGAAVWAQKLALEATVCEEMRVQSAAEVDWSDGSAQVLLTRLAAETGHNRAMLQRLISITLNSISSRGYAVEWYDPATDKHHLSYVLNAQQSLPFRSEPHRFSWLHDVDAWRIVIFEDTPENPGTDDPDLARLVAVLTGDMGKPQEKGSAFAVQVDVQRNQIIDLTAWHLDGDPRNVNLTGTIQHF